MFIWYTLAGLIFQKTNFIGTPDCCTLKLNVYKVGLDYQNQVHFDPDDSWWNVNKKVSDIKLETETLFTI